MSTKRFAAVDIVFPKKRVKKLNLPSPKIIYALYR